MATTIFIRLISTLVVACLIATSSIEHIILSIKPELKATFSLPAPAATSSPAPAPAPAPASAPAPPQSTTQAPASKSIEKNSPRSPPMPQSPALDRCCENRANTVIVHLSLALTGNNNVNFVINFNDESRGNNDNKSG